MSDTFSVKVVKINDVLVHPNAERLELAQISGWQCVVQKNAFKAGDLAVYFPIDSVLNAALESKLFGPDSKIKLSKSRVKTIKIRGAISQGMLVPCEELGVPPKEGYDCTEKLGVTKYEPPAAPSSMSGGQQVSKKKKNPHFKEYGGLNNFKWYSDLFAEGEEVVITEKIHGTNFRCGRCPTNVDTLWKRVKKVFGMLPAYEFVFGSNRVQLQGKKYKGYYDQHGSGNVYEEAVIKYNLQDKLQDGEVLYGEVYGSGIQKNYAYGCAQGEHRLVVFDLMRNGEFVSTAELVTWCVDQGLPTVPILYQGPFSAEKAKALTLGDSVLEPNQKVREGVVIKPVAETKCHMGRKVLKLISDVYLLRDDNTDFH